MHAALGEEGHKMLNILVRIGRRMLPLNLRMRVLRTQPLLVEEGFGLREPFRPGQIVESVSRVNALLFGFFIGLCMINGV